MKSRLRIKNTFGERPVESATRTAKSLYVISIAGEGKTEEQYFDGIYDLNRSELIRIERLEKADETDTKSHPNHVIELLDERKEYWEAHGVDPNELWMVVDRDQQNVNKDQLLKIIKRCKIEGYNLALSNPTFEFWLLLHLTSIELYNKEILLSNPKATAKSKKRYLEKELSKLLGGYNKNKLHFEKFEKGIKDAVSRAKELSVDNLAIIDELGTSVCLLVEKLIK
ncbi:RloB family protein [Roseimarinus sediminis]|uniref:RloB family protein n=1 Tax=Roseimarinus sediminis TaxID=1610899 RepID=UPI003D22203D